MTSTSNLADVVRHYQRSIERHGEDETRLLHCITKLFNLPITFEHLQETGIGKTVNALRKINGEVGVAAKTLVTKWKAMVAAEEEPTVNGDCKEDDSNRRSSEEDQDQENKGSNSSSGEDTRHRHKSKQEDRSRKNGEHKSKSNTISSSSSGSKSHSKSRTESDKRHKSSTHDKIKVKDSDNDRHHKDSDRHRKEQHKSSSSSTITDDRKSKESSKPSSHHHHKSSSDSSKQRHHSSSHKSHEHSKSSRHEKSKEDKTQHSEQKIDKVKSDKHHKSSSSSSKSSSSKRVRSPIRAEDESPKAKISKTKSKAEPVEEKEEEEEAANEFDSTMGANFDDVLGMLNMPMSGRKMSHKVRSPTKPATKTASTSSSSSTKRTTATTSSSSSSTVPTTRKPELLAPSAKLEPLDPSIALELPTISNNYKPMPLNQTVMDVVFNHGLGNSAPRAPRHFNESEALAAGISSKTMRTKIYSGVRTGQILQVPSLFDLCTRVLQKNIDALEYTGGVPFDVLRPVLERATPHQLLVFEEYNPYLMEDSEVLWQQHVQRHCRSQRREEMETWREMFLRCEEEKERKLSTIAESIKASQKISEAPVRKTQLAFVDSMVKPPRSVMRKQEQYGTKGKLIATPAARVAALSNVTPNAAKVGDARLRVIGTGRDAAQVAAPIRNKKAPLMAKALQLIRGRHKR